MEIISAFVVSTTAWRKLIDKIHQASEAFSDYIDRYDPNYTINQLGYQDKEIAELKEKIKKLLAKVEMLTIQLETMKAGRKDNSERKRMKKKKDQ